jgi:hypothetical protein
VVGDLGASCMLCAVYEYLHAACFNSVCGGIDRAVQQSSSSVSIFGWPSSDRNLDADEETCFLIIKKKTKVPCVSHGHGLRPDPCAASGVALLDMTAW